MHLRIRHSTTYSYSDKVFLEPHHLYVSPLARPYFRVESFDIQVNPVPQGLSGRTDFEGNQYHQCWFSGELEIMEISTEMVVDTNEFNPFDFFIEPEKPNPILQSYAKPEVILNADVSDWMNKNWDDQVDTLSNVVELGNRVHQRWDHAFNYEPNLMEPNTCFHSESASCRDVTWLMISMLRAKDIPARFVSGYAFNPELKGHELHAWMEAWIDGAGWVGVDPTSGLLTTEVYIPICASYHPKNTLPVQGGYRGDARSILKTEVTVSEI